MVYRIYTRCWREQSGVAERSDADDRLRSALNARLYSIFYRKLIRFYCENSFHFFVEKYKWRTEFTPDTGASSREWRSDADGTLRSALNAILQSISTENR